VFNELLIPLVLSFTDTSIRAIGLLSVKVKIPEVTDFRINLNCADASSISDGTKLLCLVGGTAVPYWILLIFSIIVGAIVSRMTL
jgi:hypothetical protein